MNVAISLLYSEGYWLPKGRAIAIAGMIDKFLECYQKCCSEALRKNVNRFALVPKAHMIAHVSDRLRRETAQSNWAVNPLATANQLQEDFIGRGARLSRRVHQLKLHTRVIERSLLNVFQALFPDR